MATSEPGTISAYMVAFFDTLQSLKDQQEKYRKAASDQTLSETERAEAAAAFLDLTNVVAHLKDAHEAFMLEFIRPGVAPPSAAIVDRAKSLAAGVAAEIVKKNTAAAFVEIATKLVDAWTALSTDSAGARAAPAAATLASADDAAHPKPKAKARKRTSMARSLNTAFLERHGAARK